MLAAATVSLHLAATYGEFEELMKGWLKRTTLVAVLISSGISARSIPRNGQKHLSKYAIE